MAFDTIALELHSNQVVHPQEWLYQLNNHPNGLQRIMPAANFTETVSWNYNNQTGDIIFNLYKSYIGQALNPDVVLFQDEYIKVDCKDCYLEMGVSLDLVLNTSWAHWWDTPTLDPFSIGSRGNINVHMNWVT